MAKAKRRPIAVFPINKLRKIGDFILRVRTIILNIGNHSLIFVTPAPPLATVTTDVNDLESAEVIAQTKVTGAVTDRNTKYSKVLEDVHGLQAYVQQIADGAADEEAAINIITASGFDVKVNGVRVKDSISVKNGPTSGNVKLKAKAAGKRASYNWAQSLNNGASWTVRKTTLRADTILNSLTPGTKAFFRVQPVTKDGEGDWSQAVSIIVQ